jgi:ubiquinone/menaquinone biosynthesis C-methylase UbiE
VDIEGIYDRYVADHYDKDPFGIIGSSRILAARQVARFLREESPHVIDLGMGTGEMLLSLRDMFPQAHMHGLDISAKMVEIARRKLRNAYLVQGDATSHWEELAPASMDLAVTHFVLNYVDHQRLAETITRFLRPGGLWSITTTTAESFPYLQKLALNFVDQATLRGQYNVPEHADQLEQLLLRNTFRVRERLVTEQSIEFNDLDQLLDFALHAGWFACELLVRLTSSQLSEYRQLTRAFFPIRDVAKITICLAEKMAQ